MKKTLTTAVAALVACTGPQVFAQKVKEGVITFALTSQAQTSVSNSKSTANQGNWSTLPPYYKTTSKKLTQADILRAIGYVLHGNANFYSSKAALVLVQGELSGFFNLTPDLADATGAAQGAGGDPGTFTATTFSSTVDGLSVRLATGRHFQANPLLDSWPPGHHQPWGQIFVKDPSRALCDNVTFFFAITVQECYDCFYLNSFISDATFTFKSASQNGPPCCSVPENLTGNGKDVYYMKLSFDNTMNNPYLNPNSDAWIGAAGTYAGVQGIDPAGLVADGLTPDLLPYSDPIRSGLGTPSPYEMRFSLNGLVTYTWSLKFINSSDVFPDFLGTAKYAANGYGFIGLVCTLLTGNGTISEKAAAASSCCTDLPWYDSWYGVGWNQGQSPWADFFPTPINTPVDLSFHYAYDQTYQPAIQWGTAPGPDTTVPTKDEANPSVHIPVGAPAAAAPAAQ